MWNFERTIGKDLIRVDEKCILIKTLWVFIRKELR